MRMFGKSLTRKRLDMLHLAVLVVGLIAVFLTWFVYSLMNVEPYQIAKLSGGVGIQIVLAIIFIEIRYGGHCDAENGV